MKPVHEDPPVSPAQVELPLSGVKVVAFTQYLAGPACAQYLTDMGASVTKVERVEGAFERHWAGAEVFLDGVGGLFHVGNRGARSVAIDLKTPEGRGLARRLIEEADVLVENYRPGVMERLGLGYEEVTADHEGLVYASVSGFGDGAEQRRLPGQDLLLQARSGLMNLTGRRDGPPVPVGAPVIDVHSASLLATGILGALLRRERTGRGGRVSVTMAEAAMDLQMEPFFYHLNGGVLQRPTSPIGSSFHPAPYGVYETRDGHVAISIVPLQKIQQAVFPDDAPVGDGLSDAFARRDEIAETIQERFRSLSTRELLEALAEADVWATAVQDYSDVVDDSSMRAAVQLVELVGVGTHDEGPHLALGHPVRYDGAHPVVSGDVSRLGQHTFPALTEVGVTPSEIERLSALGVVGVGHGRAEEI